MGRKGHFHIHFKGKTKFTFFAFFVFPKNQETKKPSQNLIFDNFSNNKKLFGFSFYFTPIKISYSLLQAQKFPNFSIEIRIRLSFFDIIKILKNLHWILIFDFLEVKIELNSILNFLFVAHTIFSFLFSLQRYTQFLGLKFSLKHTV